MLTIKGIKNYIKYGQSDKQLQPENDVNNELTSVLEICSKKCEEDEALRVIKLLINNGKDNVNSKDSDGYTFIHNALYAGYSQKFMIELFKLAYDNNFNINYCDKEYGDTVIHTAVESDEYIGKVAPLLRIANEMGLDVNIKNKKNKTILDVSLNPDCDYELDDEDLQDVKILINQQKDKLIKEQRRRELKIIQNQLTYILDKLSEDEREQILMDTCKTYKKTIE